MKTKAILMCLMSAVCGHEAAAQTDPFAEACRKMIDQQISARGIKDPRVLDALRAVPRHEFVPPDLRASAYEDTPLPIGHGQTISQPYIVAFMTENLEPKAADRVLEIGTGSGYQAAILSRLVKDVYTIEIVEPLAKQAEQVMTRLGYPNVHVRAGDGYKGWPDAAPFDAIIVTAAPDHVPKPLVEQLKEGGRMVIPIGESGGIQELHVFEKKAGKLESRERIPVRFVPMTGEASGGGHK